MGCGKTGLNRGVRSNRARLLKSQGVHLKGNAPGKVGLVAGYQIFISLNEIAYNILEFIQSMGILRERQYVCGESRATGQKLTHGGGGRTAWRWEARV